MLSNNKSFYSFNPQTLFGVLHQRSSAFVHISLPTYGGTESVLVLKNETGRMLCLIGGLLKHTVQRGNDRLQILCLWRLVSIIINSYAVYAFAAGKR